MILLCFLLATIAAKNILYTADNDYGITLKKVGHSEYADIWIQHDTDNFEQNKQLPSSCWIREEEAAGNHSLSK